MLDRLPSRPILLLSAAAVLGWACALGAWLFFFASPLICLPFAFGVVPAGVAWWRWARPQGTLVRWAAGSVLYVAWWPLALLLADVFQAAGLRAQLAAYGTGA